MNIPSSEKDPRILSLINHLFVKFGTDHLKIVDHWEGDLCAIGFTNGSGERLIYVSVYQKRDDRYSISLENPTTRKDFPYEPAGDFDNINLNELEKHLERHLNLPQR